jgi:hypothetical protein
MYFFVIYILQDEQP